MKDSRANYLVFAMHYGFVTIIQPFVTPSRLKALYRDSSRPPDGRLEFPFDRLNWRSHPHSPASHNSETTAAAGKAIKIATSQN
jgi:hypothetical protein